MELHRVAARFLTTSHRVVALGGSSGFSASRFARVETAGAVWCLRRWPPGFPLERLQFIHQVLVESRAEGFLGVPAPAATPAGDTIVQLDGALFDMQAWLPGAPVSGHLDQQHPMPNQVHRLFSEQLVVLTSAVAAFHQSTARLARRNTAVRRPLAQQAAAAREDVLAIAGALDQQRLGCAIDRDQRLAGRWLALLTPAVERARALLAADTFCGADVSTLCHGDIWAAHVFFDGATFTGLTDFETLTFSSPALDLAQLILHFNGWDERALVLQTYARARRIDPVSPACVAAAALLDLAREACWSLRALYGAGKPPLAGAQSDTHRFNLQTLLPSLEAIGSTP